MKKIIIGLICSIIAFTFFFCGTINEIINISKRDQKTISTNVESTCRVGNSDAAMPYECTIKYFFSYKENSYTCNKNESSMVKKDYKDNKIVYFSSSNPDNCSVETKSNYILTLIIADIIILIIVGIQVVAIKRKW